MKPRISIFCVSLLIIFLSWHAGGVTPAGRLAAIAASIIIFLFILAVITLAPSSSLSWSPSLLLALILILMGILISLMSPSAAVGRIEFWEILSLALLMAAVILSQPREGDLLYFYLFLLLWGVLLTMYGVSEIDRNFLMRRPLTSTYINRNHFSAFIGMILPISVIFGVGCSKRSVSWLSRAGCLLLLFGLILTKSRGGLLAAAVSIPAVLFVYYFSRKKIPGVLLIFLSSLAIIAIAALVYFQYRDITVYSTSLDALSIRTRFSIWVSTLKMFAARPWAGWGWGTFQYIYPQFKDPRIWYTVPHAHNEFLQIMGEGGIIGLISVIFCLGWSLSRLLKNYIHFPSTIAGLFSLGAAGSLVYGVVHASFDFILRLPANACLLTVIAGLGLASFRSEERSGMKVSSRPMKLVVTAPVILALCFCVLYPMGHLYSAYLYWQKGEALLKAGNPAGARGYFDRASDLSSGDNRPLYGKVAAKMALFERSPDKISLYRSILADLRKARRNNPWDLRPLWQLIYFHQRLSAYQEAKTYLEEALILDPTSPFLLLELARNDLIRGNKKDAARALNRAVDNYLCVWDAAGKLIFSYTDDYEILKLLPPPVDRYHRSLGYHLMDGKKWGEAEEEFHKAVSLGPENPENWRALGRLYYRINDFDQSRQCYDKVLSINPEDAQWWSELGDVLKDGAMDEEALDCYLRAHNLSPENKTYPRKAAEVLLQQNGPEAVLAFWEEVSEKNPHWDRPYYLRARLYLETGDIPRAEREIGLALERAPENTYYLNFKNRLNKLSPPDLKPYIN